LILYNTSIDFLRWRKLAMGWSIIVLLIAVGSLLIRGMNLGLDFTGGTVIEVQYPNPVEIPKVRELPWPSRLRRRPGPALRHLPRRADPHPAPRRTKQRRCPEQRRAAYPARR
jgi:hypothetical protein